MPRVDPELWRQLDAHLDELLDTPSGERESWLAALRARDAGLAAELEGVLEEHRKLAAHGFLERGPESPARPATPAPLGAYTLRSRIGQGGMGTVWLGERSDGRFEGQVAIKLLNPALVGLAAEERMKREGTILGALDHPHIARLMDAGVSVQRQPYLILEYVDGRHIDEHCREQRLGISACLHLFLDVLSAVAYAHTNLIVHRDIKPSNVLVRRDGSVKLLDFGIAKLLEGEASAGMATLSHEAGSPLTPGCAAPEQISGGPITTATDVYALGVLLYLLLTGHHPTGEPSTPLELMRAIVDTEPLRPSEAVQEPTLRRQLRGDLDTIIGKALKKVPAERYTSVVAFADDLGRYLQLQPIRARPDAPLYRAGKFVRRNRWWLAGATLTMAGLSTGLVVVNHQRAIAQKRFFEVRQLAGKLFDVDVQVRQLPGASKARQLIVDTSLDYLRRLAVDAENDPDLALEVGTAYMRSARVQGVPISPNLGQLDAAEQNLVTAQRFVDSVLSEQPDNRTAILRSGQIAHDRMILAGLKHLDDRAIALAATSVQRLEEYLGKGSLEAAEADQVLLSYMNVANRYMLAGQLDEALRMSQRTIELALANDKPIQAGAAQLVVAMALRKRGELERALQVVHEAEAVLRPTDSDTSNLRVTRFALALVREAMILSDETGPNLGRPEEAIVLLDRAFRTVEELARQDEFDVQPSGMMATAGLRLARLLRTSAPARALSLCDAILHALANKKDNTRARREEISALALATYALRNLGRTKEAQARLDDAFERLRQAKIYPASEIELGSETDDALSALADHRAATGDMPGAIELYLELLDKGRAKAPAPETDLEDAAEISRVYGALIALHHQQARADLAVPLEIARTQLWTHWRDRLPQNGYVLRQLALRD